MQLGYITGHVVATVKHSSLNGHKLMMVQPITPLGKKNGDIIIAVDQVQSGIGDRVLLLDEGTSARQILHYKDAPIRAVIVGIVDSVDLTS